MAEELDEFEVLWPESCLAHAPHGEQAPVQPSEASVPRAVHCFGLVVRSRPVDVPRRPARCSRRWKDGGDEEDGGKAIVPPHLLLSGRRRSEAWTARTPQTPCSCRRARDLRQLRDSVLLMTGGLIEG